MARSGSADGFLGPPNPPSLFQTSGAPPSSATYNTSTSPGGPNGAGGQQAPTWDSLRRQARQLENDCEARLSVFSRVAAHSFGGPNTAAGQGAVPGQESPETQERELADRLARLGHLVDQMARLADTSPTSPHGSHQPPHRTSSPTSFSALATNPAGPPPSPAAALHTLNRHRDILHDFSKEFAKSRAAARAARERSQLLGSTNGRSGAGAGGAAGMSGPDYMLTERGRIDGVSRMADEVLGYANESRNDLEAQRGLLSGADKKVTGMGARFPAITTLVNNAIWRKRRDAVVLGSLVGGLLFLFLIWFMR